MEQVVFIFHMWNARNKARRVAEVEASNLLREFTPQVLRGGPLSEKKGVFWITISKEFVTEAANRFLHLGYTQRIDRVNPVPDEDLPTNPKEALLNGDLVRWQRKYWKLIPVYETDGQTIRESSPDRRAFTLMLSDGQLHSVRGYRGDGKALSRRGLPTYDARMLFNLVRPDDKNAIFLDPYAGVGGVVLEAMAGNFRGFSSDLDPFLMHGLNQISARHTVADAQHLPFADLTIDAIATEPPYDKSAEEALKNSFKEMYRVLKIGARIAIFCAAWQVGILRDLSRSFKVVPYLDSPVNRKGTDCVILAWEKIGES